MNEHEPGKFANARELMTAIVGEIDQRHGDARIQAIVAFAEAWQDVRSLLLEGLGSLSEQIVISKDIAELAGIVRDESLMELVLEYRLRSERFLGELLVHERKAASQPGIG